MIQSFKETLAKIADRPHSLEWKTDTNETVQGVLYTNNGQLYLNVNSKKIENTIEFNYLHYESEMGGRCVLYPFEGRGHNLIYAAPVTGSTPIPIYMLVDEYALPKGFRGDGKGVTFVYESFVWIDVQETRDAEDVLYKQLEKGYNLETSIGKVSVDFPITHCGSRHPSRFSKTMDKI